MTRENTLELRQKPPVDEVTLWGTDAEAEKPAVCPVTEMSCLLYDADKGCTAVSCPEMKQEKYGTED